nr:SET and MYND domain-containing protein DDB_G0273589-like isoform X1 [Leptinotarsa decemlineata]
MAKFINEAYTTICSERTLQTNDNGFFMDFVKLIKKHAGDSWIDNEFGKLKSDKERIRCIYLSERTQKPIVNVLSNVQEVFRTKSAGISQGKRLEAEKAFQKGDLRSSLMLYSQSVLRSPETSINNHFDSGGTLSLALWGRSEVLMALKEYSLALNDIQSALKENLPNIFKADAFWRMGKCYKAMGEKIRATVSFDLCEKLLENNKKRLEELHIDREMSITVDLATIKIGEKVTPSVEGEVHEIYPCASRKIQINESEKLGKHAVANNNIRTGETLVVESPYAACLLPEMFGTHCHHCFERLKAPVGCPDCANVAFCSMACRNKAVCSYHKYECKFLDLLIGSGMSILSHTALRMITQNELSTCLEIYKNKSSERVYSLCTNAEKRCADDFFQRTLMAVFLLRCLQKAGYFRTSGRDAIPSEDEFCVGELLLYHLQMLQFSAHEIYETRKTADCCFKDSRTISIGVGIYPTVALFNHDCYPAVTRHFVGKDIVIKASRPLKRNEIIAENYGPIFTRKCLQERQICLNSRYWFQCQCNACMFNWPTIDGGLDNFSKRVKCPTESCSYYFTLPLLKDSVKCPKCSNEVTLTQQYQSLKLCEEQYEIGSQLMNENRPKEAIAIFCKAIDTFHRISCPPHKETHTAQEKLQLCVASFGNVSETLVRRS